MKVGIQCIFYNIKKFISYVFVITYEHHTFDRFIHGYLTFMVKHYVYNLVKTYYTLLDTINIGNYARGQKH